MIMAMMTKIVIMISMSTLLRSLSKKIIQKVLRLTFTEPNRNLAQYDSGRYKLRRKNIKPGKLFKVKAINIGYPRPGHHKS